ncbi:hypothetical protein M2351_008853 [Azospirillum canadense]|nr:hypothetical protein [Azospirillum canadense]
MTQELVRSGLVVLLLCFGRLLLFDQRCHSLDCRGSSTGMA